MEPNADTDRNTRCQASSTWNSDITKALQKKQQQLEQRNPRTTTNGPEATKIRHNGGHRGEAITLPAHVRDLPRRTRRTPRPPRTHHQSIARHHRCIKEDVRKTPHTKTKSHCPLVADKNLALVVSSPSKGATIPSKLRQPQNQQAKRADGDGLGFANSHNRFPRTSTRIMRNTTISSRSATRTSRATCKA